MAKKKNSGADSADAEGKPVDMTGFTLLQIIAWTNQVVMGCKEQLETEKKSNVLAHLQGQIPGCKFALEALKEQFQLNDDFMENKVVCDYASLSFEELLGAQKDIERMQAEETWTQFLARIEEKATQMKEFLLHKAKASRDMFVRQGMYEGMTGYDDRVYCEECGQRIFERFGEKNEGGTWIEGDYEKGPGVCSGPCERELCGNCGDWDVNGECEQCRNSPCGQCFSHDAEEVCKQCEHLEERKKWFDQNLFKGREDERNCHCNNCDAKFREGEIKCKGEEEFCPACGSSGAIADEPEEEVVSE